MRGNSELGGCREREKEEGEGSQANRDNLLSVKPKYMLQRWKEAHDASNYSFTEFMPRP